MTVIDNNTCVANATVVVASYASLSVTASATSLTCSGAGATATAVVVGGALPYKFLWSNGQTTAVAVGLVAGTYTVTVIDNNTCVANAVVVVASYSGLAVTATATEVTCNGGGATVTASVTGGVPPYQYSWSSGETTATVVGMSAGTQTVAVTDGLNCTVQTSVAVPTASCGTTLCTLTQGYWKTHSPGSVHPKEDTTWGLCNCYTSNLFACGRIWQWYLDSPARGSAITISAKQFIAAHLNLLKGGLDPSLSGSWSFNTAVRDCYFYLKSVYSTTCAATPSAELLRCGSLLDDFNNGRTSGVSHCGK